MEKRVFRIFLCCCLFIAVNGNAQHIIITQVYRANADSDAVYSVSIRNSSNDSIMVLHTQEANLPPFLNNYKYVQGGENGAIITLHFGKSNNPLLPEKYRATKTLPPKGQLELYFTLPATFNDKPKQLVLTYSMLTEKFYPDFLKLEKTGTNAATKKCKALKEKHGRVFYKKVMF
ncbi:MAG: hypothetical protein U0Y08_01835 [Bacteroidia bacterium]